MCKISPQIPSLPHCPHSSQSRVSSERVHVAEASVRGNKP